jgi:Na+-transporting methylmalonyl-CoA/oxaloacetate decarboxylase gamma subunit
MESIFTQGLIVTALGLAGVFLVLALFFITIKLLQKIKVKAEE